MSMKTKQSIKVYNKNNDHIETIQRVLKFAQIGNFCPAFCTYKGKNYLVKSETGDLSDPFRADATLLETLYIDGVNIGI